MHGQQNIKKVSNLLLFHESNSSANAPQSYVSLSIVHCVSFFF